MDDRTIPRRAAEQVLAGMSDSRAVCIVGPRQSGKSTLARQLLASGLEAEYFTLDQAETRRAAQEDPDGFVARLGRRTVIDEVQRVPDLLLSIKARLDARNDRGQFLLTGSANIQTLPTIQDALPGRVQYIRLWPLAACEIERTEPGFVDQVFSGEFPEISDVPHGRHEYASRLIDGGFPDALGRSDRSRHGFFADYVDSIVGRDAAEVRSLRAGASLAELLATFATRSSCLLNFAQTATRLGISAATAREYIDLLTNLMLVRQHRAWHPNLGKRVVSTPKAYVTDSGLLASLLGIDERRIAFDDAIAGIMFESFAVMEIVKQLDWADGVTRMYHYRDKDQREVDIILERPNGQLVAIEVKSTTTVRPENLRALRYLRDRLGDRFIAGVVLNTGSKTLPFGDRIAAVPLAALWSAPE